MQQICTALHCSFIFLPASMHKALPQVKEHREAVFQMIELYLKGVCNIFDKMLTHE